MIISSIAKKDTYVTNLQVGLNNASLANVGKASTLDVFKIAGESNKIKSRCKLKVIQLPSNGDTFKVQDYLKNSLNDSLIFEFVENSENTSPGELTGNNIKIGLGLQGAEFTISELCDQIKIVLDAVSNDPLKSFNIDILKLDDQTLILEQNIAGEVGDKENISSNTNAISLTNFIRIQNSCLLINFDLNKIKNYCFDENNLNNSAFANTDNYKVFLKLYDVGNASTRPLNFNLKLSVLNSDFKEGIGSDIYNFSDAGIANFVNINETDTWENPSIISKNDCIDNYFQTISHENTTDVGNEDFLFDITNYFNNYINNVHSSSSFAVSFDIDYLFDEYTYFVKRFGSSQINNPLKKPRLEVHINDDKISYITNNSKKRFIENEEEFYLFNKSNILTEFNSNFTYKLKAEYILTDGTNALDVDTDLDPLTDDFVISSEDVYDFRGVKKVGVKKFTIPNTLITRTNSDISNIIIANNKISIKLTYFYTDNNQNEVVVKSESVDFYSPSITDDYSDKRNIVPVISILNENLYANNQVNQIFVEFIDYKKEYAAVNVPMDLTSENIGDVFYTMYDIDSNKEIIFNNEANKNANKAIFTGEKYVINLFSSEIFKNKRVNFKFYYNDFDNAQMNEIYDNKFLVRFL